MISYALVKEGTAISSYDAAKLVPWWSFTKTVIAAAALALVRDNLLSLDNPLRGHPFTLRQLLRHQAGLPDYGDLIAYRLAVARADVPWTEREMLARVEADRLRYRPGDGWAYSNVGYLYVRRLIEGTVGATLDDALRALVLRPLEISGARVASSREDLAGVQMFEVENYDPRWVYHGLLVGSPEDAALLLDRLMAGDLLPSPLAAALLDYRAVEAPMFGRPWVSPGYGLGLMIGTVNGGMTLTGHTGGGPGSVIAVYHRITAGASLTCAVFATGDDPGIVEKEAARMLS